MQRKMHSRQSGCVTLEQRWSLRSCVGAARVQLQVTCRMHIQTITSYFKVKIIKQRKRSFSNKKNRRQQQHSRVAKYCNVAQCWSLECAHQSSRGHLAGPDGPRDDMVGGQRHRHSLKQGEELRRINVGTHLSSVFVEPVHIRQN